MSDDPLSQFPDAVELALTIRLTEERLLRLFSEGKLFGTVHTCIGQEFVGIAVARALQPQDTLFSNHRCHGHFLSYCGNIPGLVGEIMGKSIGVCGGRGGSQHLQQDNFYSNGILGGTTPVSAGLALGHKLMKTGGIMVVFIGDGTLGEGVVYESMNIASMWELPILFVQENNGYAQSTNQKQTLAGDICARAESFGISTAHGDTWNWPVLFEGIAESMDHVRAAGRPRFHRVDTFRLMAHSKGDDNRPEDEIRPFRERDPINRLMTRYADDPRWQKLLDDIGQRVEAAVAQAESAPFDAADFSAPAAATEAGAWKERPFEKERIVASVRRALGQALESREEVVIIGEDIESPYGGAFKCTEGLSARFPDRVRNTPISEAAITGIGNGLALSGLLPVVEIMFGDFMTLTADQWINHAAKFHFMFNGKVSVPLIVRTPMGGKRGYAATHSQSLEKHFIGVPHTQVLCLHHRDCPARVYEELFETIDRPTLVIENKTLYGHYADSEPPRGYRLLFDDEPYPTARIQPTAPADLTMVAVGGMSLEAEQALLRLFEEEEVLVDLFLPTRLYPFDVAVLADSLSGTKRLLVVEEGQGFVSLSSEILAQAAERFGDLRLRCARVCATPNAIPAARPLEERCLPGTDAIVARALELMRDLVH